MKSITISQAKLNEILSPPGVPVIDITDLELSKDQVINLSILPALREYYIWFPLTSKTSLNVSGEFSVDFPDEQTYGVADARVTVNRESGGVITSNPFVNERIISSMGSRYRSLRGMDTFELSILDRSRAEATVNLLGTRQISVDEQNRVVTGYSNVGGALTITWAKWSENFSDVPFRRLPQVIKLCQSYVLENLGMIRGQQESNINAELNYQLFLDKARDLREEVMTAFKEYPKVVVLRN